MQEKRQQTVWADHLGFIVLFLFSFSVTKSPHTLDPAPLPYLGLKQSTPHCLWLLEKHTQQHNCSACPSYQKSCFRQLREGDLTCHRGRCSPRVNPLLQWGTPGEKPLRHRYLSLHCHVITGESSQLIFWGHLLVSEVTIMHCSKLIEEIPTFFLILSSLKGANLALQQPMQHTYRLQSDPKARRAFIHVQ